MKKAASFSWILLPILILAIISIAIYFERAGISYTADSTVLNFLDPLDSTQNLEQAAQDAKCLILYDSINDSDLVLLTLASDTLDNMRVNYNSFDVSTLSDDMVLGFQDYETIIVAFYDLEKINPSILELAQWVEDGGKMLFTIRPEISDSFVAIYRKLGILSFGYQFTSISEIVFTSDLFPGMKTRTLETSFNGNDTSLAIQLENEAQVHLQSADRNATAILWDYDYGEGRFVVINSDQFINKADRGLICAAYSLLYDVFIYPVINSSMVFIDDFPGPIPEGTNETIFKEFGRDIESFYVNIWWQDMKDFARRYGLKYTGLLIETYNDKTSPPFIEEKSVEQYDYFGNSLLGTGGEIGLHGYNHIPLVTDKDAIPEDLDYPVWSSEEAMQLSIQELYTFSVSLYPEQQFLTYVPPSNILSQEARAWLPDVIPELKVISSHYLPVQGSYAYYEQEFEEAADGIIEVPRIIAGYEITPYLQWTAVNELVLHYVNSHFIHPDDFLDEDRSDGNGWTYLREKFEEYLMWLESTAPGIRQMTASEGGTAVQRYARLDLTTKWVGSRCTIDLVNFYDEAWLLMRSSSQPLEISGGSITEVNPTLYLIGAESAQVEITFKE